MARTRSTTARDVRQAERESHEAMAAAIREKPGTSNIVLLPSTPSPEKRAEQHKRAREEDGADKEEVDMREEEVESDSEDEEINAEKRRLLRLWEEGDGPSEGVDKGMLEEEEGRGDRNDDGDSKEESAQRGKRKRKERREQEREAIGKRWSMGRGQTDRGRRMREIAEKARRPNGTDETAESNISTGTSEQQIERQEETVGDEGGQNRAEAGNSDTEVNGQRATVTSAEKGDEEREEERGGEENGREDGDENKGDGEEVLRQEEKGVKKPRRRRKLNWGTGGKTKPTVKDNEAVVSLMDRNRWIMRENGNETDVLYRISKGVDKEKIGMRFKIKETGRGYKGVVYAMKNFNPFPTQATLLLPVRV